MNIVPVEMRDDATTQGQGRVGAFSFFNSDRLARIYDTNWLARRVVDTRIDHAFRRGFRVKDDDGALCKAFELLDHSDRGPDGKTAAACKKGLLYGGSAIFLFTRAAPPETPLNPNEELLGLEVIRRDQLVELARERDPNLPTFGQIMLYRISGDHPRTNTPVHASRLVLCEGLVRESRFQFSALGGPEWPWLSILQPVNDTLEQFDGTWASVSRLISEISVGVITIKGLTAAMSKDMTGDLESRLTLLSRTISVYKKMFLDAEAGETFTRTAVSFSDVPALLVQYAQLVAAASEIPVTLLMGMSPAGLNATGESDLRQFYDRVRIYQEKSLAKKLERIISLIAHKPVQVEFPPLWEPTALEKAQTRSALLAGDRAVYDMGGISAGAMIRSRLEDGTLGLEIDPSEIADAVDPNLDPALDPALGGPPAPALPVDTTPAEEALNGAQITGLLEVLDKFYTKGLPREAALETLQLAFPSLPTATAQRLLLQGFTPAAPPASPGGGFPPRAPAPSPPEPAPKV